MNMVFVFGCVSPGVQTASSESVGKGVAEGADSDGANTVVSIGEGDAPCQRPTQAAAPRVIVDACRIAEPGSRLSGEQHPRNRQIAGRISGGDVTEVDDARQPARNRLSRAASGTPR